MTVCPVLKTMRSRMAGTLSGGRQQPLLDEPTEGCMPSVMLEIEDLILALRERRDMAILLVEQYVDFALAVADDYYIVETGAIVARGPVSSFDHARSRDYLAV